MGYVNSCEGKSPLFTSSRYFVMPPSASLHRSAYCLTNLGILWPGSKFPVMSAWTKTCPEQPLPAPMLIVGTRNLCVIIEATSAGIASRTTMKAPAFCIAMASCRSRTALSADLPCTLNPPRRCRRWGVSPTWPTTGIPAWLSKNYGDSRNRSDPQAHINCWLSPPPRT